MADFSLLAADSEKVERELEQTRQRLNEAAAEAKNQQYSATSPDNSVTAVVNGMGSLVSLSIDDGELRGAHPRRLGPKIVATVDEARSLASTHSREVLAELLPDFTV